MTENKIVESWDDLNLNDNILRGIFRYGYEKPTPIQCQAILPIINNKDVIAQAQSGTGKTGSFVISSLQKIDNTSNCTQILIIAPTRELVKQISSVTQALSSCIEKIKIKTLVGGTSVNEDISYLKNNNPHIIIGTTGRIYDMIRRKHVDTNSVKLLVLDEADEMLSKGFKTQVKDTLQVLPVNMQIALFSATIPNEILNLTNKFMKDPVKITLKPEELTLECIEQYYVALNDDKDKFDCLKDLFSILQVNQSIIYVNTIKRVDDLYNAMNNEGYPVCYIHSLMDKSFFI